MAKKYVTVKLSSTGLTPSSTIFDIYTDSNNFGYPVLRDRSNTELTATTNPFNLLVPSNSSKIMVLDKSNGKKTYSDIAENYLCDTCDLGFDYFQTSTVGRLYGGNLTGSCQSPITDYRIFWYGPGPNSTNIAYISGKGTAFSYNYTHPLTGTTAIFADAGEYFPVIDKLKINGITFSQTGDTIPGNGPVPADLECFQTVNVGIDAFRCDNGGTSNLPQYDHRVSFTALGNGSTPQPLQSTFLLSATTKYFAINFEGYLVPDEIKISFVGSHYNNIPILLEYWRVGNYETTQTTTLPYVWNSYSYYNQYYPLKKLINFENFVLNTGDKLILEVIPNTSNPQTNWDYYFTCIGNQINCDFCQDPTQYKIQQSSISYNASTNCTGAVSVTFNVSGCSSASISTLLPTNEGLGDYFGMNNTLAYNLTPNGSNLIANSYDTNTGFTACTYYTPTPVLICGTPASGSEIKLEKTIVGGKGQIDMTFNSISDLGFYYNAYKSIKNSIWSTPVADTIYSSSTNTYYKFIQLSIPNTESDPTKLCGDGITAYSYRFHPSATVTTGQTSPTGPWTMTIDMPIVTENISGDIIPCYVSCSSLLNTYLSVVNGSSTATTNNKTFITNTGQKFATPFQSTSYYRYITAGWNSDTTDGYVPSLGARNITTAFSGVSNTPIPSLTAITCDTVIQPTYKYAFKVIMEPNFRDFKVYASPITAGLPLGYPSINYNTLVLTSTAGVITVNDANYVY